MQQALYKAHYHPEIHSVPGDLHKDNHELELECEDDAKINTKEVKHTRGRGQAGF